MMQLPPSVLDIPMETAEKISSQRQQEII